MKPAPCVGCGYCCQKTTCMAGLIHAADPLDCQFLTHDGDRHWCQLALDNPELHVEMAIGAGCSSSMFNTQREAQLARMRKREE